MSHLIFKTTPQSIIIPILPMEPFQCPERGSDLPKVTQLEEPTLKVRYLTPNSRFLPDLCTVGTQGWGEG